MNCLNKSSVSAGARLAIEEAIGAGEGIKDTGLALRLTNRWAKVFTLVEVELLEWEDLLELFAYLIGLAAVSFLATF